MLVRLFLLLCVLGVPTLSEAAIAFVSQTDATATQNVSSVTFSQTVGAGTDRALFVCSQARHNATPGKSITSVTFGGVALTKIRADARNGSSNAQFITELWYLIAPAVSTANVIVTYSGANTDAIGVSSTLLTGVNQSSVVDSQAGSGGAGTAISAVITTVADGAWIIDCAIGRANGGLTVGAGQTVRTDRLLGTVTIDGAGVSTVNGKATAGSETMNWTQGGTNEDWAISTVSITPSGGSDPEPTIPSQVTLTWTNGTDGGSNPSGIGNTSIRRCTGNGCIATTAPIIGTKAFPLTSYVDGTVGVNTTYGYSAFHTDGAGNPSTNHTTVYITTSDTPPDAPPRILSAVTDATGSSLVYDGVIPTKIKVVTFTNLHVVSSVVHLMTDFPGGRFTQAWRDGLQGVCFIPIDEDDLENPDPESHQCDDLTGIVGPADTTPPVLTCPATIELPAGITEWSFSCQVNKPNTSARFEITDVAYSAMTNQMAVNSLTFSGLVDDLTDDSTTTLYVRGQLEGLAEDEGYPNLTSQVVVIHVAAAAGDITPPGDVTNLAATLLGNAVSLQWDSATDAVSYQVYQAEGACSTYAPAGNPVGTANVQFSLQFNTVYCWIVKALDVVNNLSTNFSNSVTKTTGAAPDVERPSDLEGLIATPVVNSITLNWTRGTDNSGFVFTNLEKCEVPTGQTDCVNFSGLVSEVLTTYLVEGLTANTTYCFRGKNNDASGNVSLNYNTPVCSTTTTIGVGQPHVPLRFGADRGVPSARPAPASKSPRP